MCECEFCEKCKCCGHTADSHMCGDGPCMIKGCPCSSLHDEAYKSGNTLEQFADIDLNPELDTNK